MAWYSEQSVPRLQRMAAEEVARGLRGEPLKNQVNR
jgi:D-3-phosphoglycerate dehydrogenase